MEKNVGQRLLIIGLVVLVAGVFLSQGLRPGQDIAGGTSMIFEIDLASFNKSEWPGIAERVKQQLQQRVDPQGVYDLTWRVHGANRIEVQMPLPPKDAKERRAAYQEALDELYSYELTRGDIERALQLAGDARVQALQELAGRNADAALAALDDFKEAQALSGEDRRQALRELADRIGQAAVTALEVKDLDTRRAAIEKVVGDRLDLLVDAAERYDAVQEARTALERGPEVADTQATTAPADQPKTREDLQEELRDAEELYEDAVAAVMNTNVNRRRFEEILELEKNSEMRQRSLGEIKAAQADLRTHIEDVVAKFEAWRSGKRALDGPSDLKRLMRGAGRLEFRILPARDPGNPTKFDDERAQLQDGRTKHLENSPYGWFEIDNPLQFFNLDTPAELEEFDYENYHYVIDKVGDTYYVLAHTDPDKTLLDDTAREWTLEDARVQRNPNGQLEVHFQLDVVGGDMFADLTRANIDNPLCILVDDVAYSAANIQSTIRRSGRITGDFSPAKVNYLVRTMEGGTLAARLKDTPLSERTVGSSLGETNRDRAVRAGLYGGVAVILIMLIYYGACGAIANVALALNVMLILAAMAMLNARITLVGIAGIILSVGMAVDANVLIYERIREEKDRGSSLRMMIKNGYDKALSTIFDANITTLLTCVIIYYVGSEEVKGFGLTLGWGIVLNLFTSIFVTRTFFLLLAKYNVIKDLKMMRLVGVPNIDWYAKRKIFLPISLIILVIGLGLLFERGGDAFDVEFRGGVAAEFEVTDPNITDAAVSEALEEISGEINAVAQRIDEATVTPVADELATYRVALPDAPASLLAAMVTEPLEDRDMLQRGNAITAPADTNHIIVRTKGEVTTESLTEAIHGLKETLTDAAGNLAQSNVNAVLEVGGVAQQGLVWNLTTTVTNQRLVQHALVQALEDKIAIQPSVAYNFQGDGDLPYPVTNRNLNVVVPGLRAGLNREVTDYLDGAAMRFTALDPPQTVATLRERIDNMHFQPDFEDQPKRRYEIIGLTQASGVDGSELTTEAGEPLWEDIVVLSVDPDLRYRDDADRWAAGFAMQELSLIRSALADEQTLRKVMQFKPQIADRSTQQAFMALLLSWAMIILYLWIRFGRPMYGIAGVAALIHDALIALAFVGISGWIGGHDHPWGEALLISDFKINMTVVAALLTIIGYSINDTIVVFDRIRETRGRLGQVTPEIINTSINQTLARTIMTSFTTFVVLLLAYWFGGSSIRAFNYCMMIGVITGSYSSIAIASPLLMVQLGKRFGGAPAAARAAS